MVCGVSGFGVIFSLRGQDADFRIQDARVQDLWFLNVSNKVFSTEVQSKSLCDYLLTVWFFMIVDGLPRIHRLAFRGSTL